MDRVLRRAKKGVALIRELKLHIDADKKISQRQALENEKAVSLYINIVQQNTKLKKTLRLLVNESITNEEAKKILEGIENVTNL